MVRVCIDTVQVVPTLEGQSYGRLADGQVNDSLAATIVSLIPSR